MNRWLLIRRMRGPAFLVLFGVLALLNQWDVLSFRRSWPLCLIVAGLLLLAERAALAGASLPPAAPGPLPYYPVSGAPLAVRNVDHPADASSPGPENTAFGGK